MVVVNDLLMLFTFSCMTQSVAYLVGKMVAEVIIERFQLDEK